jgi:hypothetical protein
MRTTIRFSSFAEFYPYYLSEHSDRTCRRLHFVGTSLALALIFTTLLGRNPWLWLAVPLAGYGHFSAPFLQPLG